MGWGGEGATDGEGGGGLWPSQWMEREEGEEGLGLVGVGWELGFLMNSYIYIYIKDGNGLV